MLSIDNDAKFWSECCKYFNDVIAKHNGKLGGYFSLVSDTISFDDSSVFKMNTMSHDNKMKLNPIYFQNISGTVSLISFLIRDALEYCGVLYSDKTTPPYWAIRNLYYDKGALSILDKYLVLFK